MKFSIQILKNNFLMKDQGNEYSKMSNDELIRQYRLNALESSNSIIEAGRLVSRVSIKEEFLKRGLKTDGTPITAKDIEMATGRAERLRRAEKDNQRANGLNMIFMGGLALLISIGMLFISSGRGIMYGLMIIGLIFFVRGVLEFIASKK